MSRNKDILAISAGVREKMDRQYLEDTRSLKNVGNCFRSARNLYDKVLLVEKVLIRIHEYKKDFYSNILGAQKTRRTCRRPDLSC